MMDARWASRGMQRLFLNKLIYASRQALSRPRFQSKMTMLRSIKRVASLKTQSRESAPFPPLTTDNMVEAQLSTEFTKKVVMEKS